MQVFKRLFWSESNANFWGVTWYGWGSQDYSLRELNLDMERFNKKLQDSALQDVISLDLAKGERIGVNSTPTVYINGKLLKDRSLQGIQEIITMELGKP